MLRNLLLTELALEDQEARRGGSPVRTDLDRLRLVLGEIGAGRVHTNDDRRNAALVLQHSPLAFRDDVVVAISPHDYLLAHHLATDAERATYGVAPLADLLEQFPEAPRKQVP